MERQPASVDDVVLPIIWSDERWGPRPGRWRDQIPPHTNKIPHPRTYELPRYEDHRTQVPVERPDALPEWERPEPKHEMGYERTYDDGKMAVIRNSDAKPAPNRMKKRSSFLVAARRM